MHKVNADFFRLLKAHGLVDNSHLYAQMGYNGYQGDKAPAFRKSTFGNSYNRQMLVLNIDYCTVYVSEYTSIITDIYVELTECQLKSILTYFKLSIPHRIRIRKATGNKIEQCHDHKSVSFRNSAAAGAFGEIYNNIRL